MDSFKIDTQPLKSEFNQHLVKPMGSDRSTNLRVQFWASRESERCSSNGVYFCSQKKKGQGQHSEETIRFCGIL